MAAQDPVLRQVFETVLDRKKTMPEKSYVAKLLRQGPDGICCKLAEETGEVIKAAREQGREEFYQDTKGQGGAGSCVGLPSYSYFGWAVNVTVTGYGSGLGYMTIWPAGGTEPNASVINYQSAPYALAKRPASKWGRRSQCSWMRRP